MSFGKPKKHFTKRLIEIRVGGTKCCEESWHYGFLFNLTSLWIGVHYSHENKRYCMNLIPCCTIWWTKKGGLIP